MRIKDMRPDLTPFYRSTVGFDRFFQLMDTLQAQPDAQSWPPYNIERTGENAYRISMAVAGFTEADIAIESKDGVLTVTAKREGQDKRQFLHQGIAARAFDRRFQLADYVEATGASLENGLLHIDLVREIPEAKKPRRIAIGTPSHAAVTVTAEAA
jgi:molecular chaperone IbpA